MLQRALQRDQHRGDGGHDGQRPVAVSKGNREPAAIGNQGDEQRRQFHRHAAPSRLALSANRVSILAADAVSVVAARSSRPPARRAKAALAPKLSECRARSRQLMGENRYWPRVLTTLTLWRRSSRKSVTG